MKILFIRHGQTPANVLGQLDTAHPGPGLTALGHRQAEAIPAALSAENIDAIYVSTLVRTQFTAAPLARHRKLEREVIDGIHEIDASDLEGQGSHAAAQRYLETVFAWAAGDLDLPMPGGPNGHDFFGRFDAAVEAIGAGQDDTVAVVSHGAAIRTWTGARATNVDVEYAAEHALSNTGVVIVRGSVTDGWVVDEWDGEPIGGPGLRDDSAADPTGEALD